jgi:GNAT superfamily N-acetyltransferase
LSSELRIATADDRPAVEAIVEAAYRHYIARIGQKPGPMLDDYGAQIAAGRVHVMACDGEPKGLLVLIPEADAMLLDNVAVHPSAQGKGLGRQMMIFAEQAARDAGYRTIRLYTNAMMTENIALYTRAGYVETHRGVENGLHRVYMTKRL